ncbi:MAG: hypothetical protein OQK12_03120 [Motiliproteus sp.]|nr:hypothetical protein [Motiliproteus sp.]MCW9053518.1 hypothetical protein [Motiliproteus sp.]
MTAQIPEKIRLDGQRFSMCSTPLNDFVALGGRLPKFAVTCTALWRGYIGSWELLDGRLYLNGLTGSLEDGEEITLATLFPDFPDRVFAHWYSGTLRIPQGKLIEYHHAGFASEYERDLLLTFERGILQEQDVHQNGLADKGAPEGYSIAAMTVFGSDRKRDES